MEHTKKEEKKESPGTKAFKETIEKFLDGRAKIDPLFKESYQNPKKNIDDCITYILNTVQETQCHGFADSEIYNMAMHYYDEADIKVGNELKVIKVIVNHKVELTAEEIAEAKEKAREQVIYEEQQKMRKPTAKKVQPAKEDKKDESLTLF